MTIPPLIELKNICFSYPGSTSPLFKELNLTIDEERIGLIGPNGCGKTSLLHLIVGLIRPAHGTLFFRGKKVCHERDFRPLRSEVGFLFQNSDDQLFSPTVLEDICFGPLNQGLSGADARTVAERTMTRLGIGDFKDQLTHNLSGGEKKLVALATILAMEPKLLLLDEPTNNLDPQTRIQLTGIIKGLELPHIIISHDWDFLEETSSVLYTIDHGLVRHCGHEQIHSHHHIHPYGNQPHRHDD
ncbi:MAG: ABC transporter ATP-binding protein [Thermodesulfobacteriota bacterium]